MEDRIDPIHPGEILSKDFLEPMGITAYRLARDVRIDQTRVSEIIRGKRGISADTALRLGKYFDVSAEFWLNIQRQYDLEQKRLELKAVLAEIPTLCPVVAENSPPYKDAELNRERNSSGNPGAISFESAGSRRPSV